MTHFEFLTYNTKIRAKISHTKNETNIFILNFPNTMRICPEITPIFSFANLSGSVPQAGRETQHADQHRDIRLVFKQIRKQLNKSVLDSIMAGRQASQKNNYKIGFFGRAAPGRAQFRN